MPLTDEQKRERIVRRIARELRDGFYVNLGIGIPTLVANHVPPGMEVILQSENGMLGVGPYPLDSEVVLKGMGGAMDLVAGAKRVFVAMEHATKDGKPKILRKCSLPLTGVEVVDHMVTELAVIEVTPDGLVLREIAEDTTVEQVQALTEPKLLLAAGGPKLM